MPDGTPTPLAAPVITRTPIQDDDGSGTTGTVLDNAWKQELYGQIDALAAALQFVLPTNLTVAGWIAERGRPVPIGEWITVPFSVANFWTGVTAAQIGVNRYTLIGKTMIWQLQISGAPAPSPSSPYAMCIVPGGLSMVSGGTFSPVAYLSDNGVIGTGMGVMGSAIQLALQRSSPAGNWAGPLTVYLTAILNLA